MNPLVCVQPYYYILIRETTDDKMNHQLENLQQEFLRKTAGHSQIMTEAMNETKISELMEHIKVEVIGRGQLNPKFIEKSCRTAKVVIYLQRNDNPGRLPELVKTLGFMTAHVRKDNTLELELIATSQIYRGCGSTMMNTFLHSARDAGFEHLYLYSLLSPMPFYQGQKLTLSGYNKISNKDYMIMDLQKNSIPKFDISRIAFDPPKPGTIIKVPTRNKLMEFMAPNQPYQNVSREHMNDIREMLKFRKTAKNGKRYLNQNSYAAFLQSRKRGRQETNRRTGINRFRNAVRQVIKRQRK